jgi:hypothetical protein
MKTQAKDAVALAMDWLAQLRDEDSEPPGGGKPAIDGVPAAGDPGDVPSAAPPAGELEDAAPAAPPATDVWDADPSAPLAAHWGYAAPVPPPAADFRDASPPAADWRIPAPAVPPAADWRDAHLAAPPAADWEMPAPAAPPAADWREAAPPAADGGEARPAAPAADWEMPAPAAPPAADWREATPPAADGGEARPGAPAADWEMPAPVAPPAADAWRAAPPPGPAAAPPWTTASGRAGTKAGIEITERAAIGDELRIPLAWCEMGSCISHYADPEALGEADIRARAIAAGWRVDALGRLACPQCQQGDSWFWTAHPVALWDRDTAVAMTTLLAAAVREITGADGAAGVEPGAIPGGKRNAVPGPRPEMARSPGRGRHRGHPAHPDRAQ